MQTLLCLVAAVLICLPSIGSAAYPERVINMIIAYAPGGGIDVVARALAPYLEKHVGANARIVVLKGAGARRRFWQCFGCSVMFLNPKKFTGNLVSGDGESAGRSLSYDEAIAEAGSWLERRS